MNIVEKLSYKIVKAYVLDKSNKKQEALEEMDEVCKDIISNNILDYQLID